MKSVVAAKCDKRAETDAEWVEDLSGSTNPYLFRINKKMVFI
jgi:hypothetical protein